MKKFLSTTIVVIMITALFVGCASKPAAQTPSSTTSAVASGLPDKYKTAGKIRIGVDDSYPPMEYRDETNTLVGFDVDFGNAIGKKLGTKIEWTPTAWDGILPALKASKFDMILSSLSITDDRKKEIGFTDPYIVGGPIVVINPKDTSIKTKEDLKGKIVGVQLGSTGEEALKSISGIKDTKKYDKITEALQDLSAGRVQAVVADDQVGRYYIGLDPTKYSLAAKLVDEPFGIGFRQDDSALTTVVQKAINDLKADGTLSKISMKWFKTDYYK